MIKYVFTLTVLFVFSSMISWGNNISISNITSVPGSGFVQLQFDLSWDNSWKNSTNYDAAWVFFKWKDNDGTWRHLNLTNANNAITAGYTINVPADLMGALIYRNVVGAGSVSLTGVKVGVVNLPGSFDVRAFAIEMVQIPIADQYYLGDGEAGTYYAAGVSGLPYLVNTNTLTMGSTSGLLYDGIGNGTLATGFPIGYNSNSALSVFMMKHEISQGAYRDFLNTLTYTQQATRTAVAPNSVAHTEAIGLLAYRNGIQIATPGVASTTPAIYGCNLNNNSVVDEATDGEWVACNYLAWMDLAAFLDWAALRPMTEMEFEKSARGTIYPVSAENAAGTTAAAAYTYPISNLGTANEAVTAYSGSVLNGNFTYNGTSPGGNSPLRVGIHATAYATRISAGAGYYGCLDLSGNVTEWAVTSANAAGRSFTGINGDGALTASGDANEDFWPGINGNSTITSANTFFGTIGVTNAAGIIDRGGAAGYTGANLLKVSYRIAPGGTSTRTSADGGRGVKSL